MGPAIKPGGLSFLRGLEDSELLARCIYGEARGEGIEGMIAVGHVILNRCDAGGYGEGLKGVILRRRQFSCFNSGDPNFIKLTQPELHDDAISVCRDVARRLLEMSQEERKADDPTHGATHYHAASIRPYWTKSLRMVFCRRIGGHLFWKEV
ncbi:MAG: cell wall hydrolase [Syntrophobacteraceae bacterium]|nr:cell wall hydrolase [Syntrophobacteraceae bacterium]